MACAYEEKLQKVKFYITYYDYGQATTRKQVETRRRDMHFNKNVKCSILTNLVKEKQGETTHKRLLGSIVMMSMAHNVKPPPKRMF